MAAAWDVTVVGAGAAGLLAGIAAGRTGARVLVLEKGERPGRKLLLTGGGRCNFTNTLQPNEFVARFGDPGARKLGHALTLFGALELRALLARHGVEERLEREIRLYTKSGRAAEVVEALTAELTVSSAGLELGAPVRELAREGAGFRLRVGDSTVQTRTLILCTGGVSYPATGSTGEGHEWARALGHEVHPPRPGLIGLETEESWPRELAGLVLGDAAIELLPPEGGKRLASERAELLFTHQGLSGPAILDLSLALARQGLQRAKLRVDFLPSISQEQSLLAVLEARALHPRRSLARALEGRLPSRLLERLAGTWQGPVAGLSRATLAEFGRRLKGTLVEVRAPTRIQAAEVTVGGIAWSQIDPARLESRRVPGLFFAGELLDLAGRCGGFNLQAAFSSGFLAGSAAAATAGSGPDGKKTQTSR